MTSQFPFPPDYYSRSIVAREMGPGSPAATSSEENGVLGPFCPVTNPKENYFYHAFLATNAGRSSSTVSQAGSCGHLIDTPGLQAFLELQANSGDIIFPPRTPNMQPQGINGQFEQYDDTFGPAMEVYQPNPTKAYTLQSILEQDEFDGGDMAAVTGDTTGGVVPTMPLVGQSSQMPLHLEDEGETVRPGQIYATPPIGLSTEKYSFICTPSPATIAHIKTMPVWQPLLASATSGPMRQNDQGLEAVKQIEVHERLAAMMGMTLAERQAFQVNTYGFHDLVDDLPVFQEKIKASFEPNEEEVDCPYGCPRMKVERMRYHLEGVHLPGRLKVCTLCSKEYKNYQRTIEHLEAVHCDWTFSCKVCERKVTRNNMIDHFRLRCKGIWPPLSNGGKKAGTE